MHLAATAVDEAQFLSFLQDSAEIALIDYFAPTIDDLWPSAFATSLSNHWSYSIWNTRFPWTPDYAQVGTDAYHQTQVGWYYVANLATAPVIEFTRSDVQRQQYGRIYWAKNAAAPDGLDYDVQQFEAWYKVVVGWVRKHGRKVIQGAYQPYFLPDAWIYYHQRHG